MKTFRVSALDGGLNLRDAELNLKDNESPEMVNLWWADGLLQSRPGQERVTEGWPDGDAVVAYAAAPFEEGFIVHINSALYAFYGDALHVISGGVPCNAGNFFRFGDALYYKNVGGFYRLSRDAGFTLTPVTESAYVPTIQRNTDPATGQGDAFEPVNRLSDSVRVTYTPAATETSVVRTGDGASRIFTVGVTSAENLRGVSAVYVNNTLTRPALYDVDLWSGSVVFHAAPPEDAVLTFTLDLGERVYCLPTESVAAVTGVKVSGLTMVPGRDYTVDAVAGVVTFTQAPPLSGRDSVEITYRKPHGHAAAVLNCPYAAGYASGNQTCIVMGGGADAPNAVLWSGDGDASYWPLNAFAEVGSDAVTAFAAQHGQLIVLKARSVGKLSLSAKEVNGYAHVSLSYAGVNDKIGCDLPRSVQLIGNNVTFANASGGVYRLRSSSAARENNVELVSEKVNGSDLRPGLLHDLRVAGGGPVCSLDDGQRYWLAVNGHAWLWDYSLSDSPVWFFFAGLDAHAFAMRAGVPYLVDGSGSVVRLGRTLNDFGGPVRKVYQFPVRNFGSYDRLKDVRTLLLSARADTPCNTTVTYESDYETRTDAVNLTSPGYDRLTERDLEVRDLSVPRHAAVFRREPKCVRVRHFSLRLENNTADCDLSILSAELQIRYVGREK